MGRAADKGAGKPRGLKQQKEITAATRIESLITAAEGHFSGDSFKITVADYIRLIQMSKEFEKEKPRDIEVLWVETPCANELNAA
jgi:hypothetical protein